MRDGFVERRIEALRGGVDALDAEALELREELAPHHLDPLEQRIGRGAGGGFDGALEVVEDLEHLGEDVPPRPLDVLGDLPAQPERASSNSPAACRYFAMYSWAMRSFSASCRSSSST